MKHLLSISTLYPNAVNPRFGTFVARSLEALARRGAEQGDWQVSVVNPIGLPPVALGRYRALSKLPKVSKEHGVTIYRPRFTLIPAVGARRNALAIAKAALPIVQKIHAENPIDLIDAQFFFPDGPAAAWLAQEMDLPLSLKARGSDITYWGTLDFARDQMVEAAHRAKGLLAVSGSMAEEMAVIWPKYKKLFARYR